MPDLPPDWALPMQEIVLHSACELQTALRTLDDRKNSAQFNARGWNIKVTLNPKVDADVAPSASLGRKIPFLSNSSFSNWGVGAGADMKGERTGSVDFSFDSSQLIDDRRLNCELETPSYHSLTKQLRIAEWLYRSVDAAYASGSSIASPNFTSDVNMKFSGNGSYTFTFPVGTRG